MSARASVPFFLFLLLAGAQSAELPTIFWISDPLQPDETALVAGANFDEHSTVELVRLTDLPPAAPELTAKLQIPAWTQVPVLQAGEQSLKFVIPAALKTGVFACRIHTGESVSETYLINRPDVWWMQGNDGDSCAVGGELRICGKCLGFGPFDTPKAGAKSFVWLKAETGDGRLIEAACADGYSLRVRLPDDIPAAEYTVYAHNGFGGNFGWARAGTIRIHAADKWPETIFNVMDFYGKDKDKEIQRTVRRGSPAVDRTEAIQAALKKAQDNGGGVVFFPAGIYGIQSELKIPPRTIVKGEGMGLALLWWGKGSFALDGGGSQERKDPVPNDFPGRLLFGDNFGLEDLSLYVPLASNSAIQAGNNFQMHRVRVRVDRYWMRTPQRQNGCFLRVGSNFAVTDCDILAKGTGVALGSFGVLARNRIQAGKCNCEMGHAANVIIEDNQFVSLDPTAYINVYEEGRNIYYARNRHESLYVDQSDYSFTFDGPGGAYLGKISACEGNTITLAADPQYLKWAGENSNLWKKSVVCILAGHGAGQFRFVTGNHGREWKIETPFAINPDSSSTITIAPFRGHALVVGNRFEDANWVNMGYGSSFEVICANNLLYRSGQLLNYGLKLDVGHQPSWYVQYLNNDIFEGHTSVDTLSPYKVPAAFEGPVTRYTIHRGTHIHADNSGSIKIGGNATDVLVEHCKLDHPGTTIGSDNETAGVVFRDNEFADKAEHYQGKAALIVTGAVSK